MKQTYGVPALCSFIIPGTGQILKGHYTQALVVWAGLLIAWKFDILSGPAINLYPPFARPGYNHDLANYIANIVAIWVAIIAWLWGAVDAYRRPH